ncbi:phage tail protein [Blautia coccoides]|uniref:phage tail protein n=1 Tax=Blautia producta TaxID=33035 RepID=UPI00214A1B6D|nr:phage tail protein [Blautia coccoides]MCR1987870.1 phage tail protein [Blautia coccoides]
MYRVYCNDSPLYDLRDEDLVLISPTVKIGENTAGSFEFSILPKHPHYEEVNELTSVITAYDGDEEIFCGRVVEITKDLYNRKKVICEGELAYFNDSIQRPAKYQGLTVRGYLETLVNIHNQQVKNQGIDKTFKVGAVTVQDNNDYVYKYTNWESTLEVIKTDLLNTYGGYLRIRKENGVRYIDYLADYPNTNTQVIEFGSNLLDFTHDMVASDIVTAVIPLGARLEDVTEVEGLDAYLTIKDVNGGVDYVYSQEAVKSYGWIFKTVKWDDVHVADNLLRKGKEYLSDIQFAQITLTVSAVDLHMLHVDMERIKVLDEIRVTSSPNGLDRFFPVSEMTIYLDKPSNNKLTLGTSYSKNSLSTKTESNMTSIKDKIDSLPNKSEILEEARENASQLIHSATNGHVVTTADEQLIMDTADKKTARKLWRWNLNGLGYSKTGYNGTYDTAITMDGQIVGERLVGGSVTADKLSVSYKSSVEKQISDAIDDSNDYTDDKLKSYWTRVEVETAIKNTKDAVLISAKETATSYTDDKLKSYSTSAQIKVKTDSIESEVKKKLNSSELSTKIQQNASAIKIAWNNISKYVQFESGELRIYDSAITSSQKLVSKFNYNGCHFYRNDYYVGKIGTNELQSDSSKKGLNFDLESNGAYMTWASKDSSSANVYTMKWTYVQKNKGWGNYTSGELHAGCNIDMHGWTLKNPSFEGGGINGTLNFVQVLKMSSDGTVASWSNGCKMQFKNGILISGTWNG